MSGHIFYFRKFLNFYSNIANNAVQIQINFKIYLNYLGCLIARKARITLLVLSKV